MVQPLTDEQRLFAAKYVENGCQLELAAKSMRIKVARAYQLRADLRVQAEIDKLIAASGQQATVSRGFFLMKHLEIIEKSLAPQPILFQGIATRHYQIKPGPALTALKQLADEGFLREDELQGAVDDVNARVTDIRNELRARRDAEAAGEPAEKTKLRRVRDKNVRSGTS